MSVIKDKIRELRGTKSQHFFGKICGVGQSTIAGYEKGVRTPDIDFLLTLCEKCNVTPNWLLGFEDERPAVITEKIEKAPEPVDSQECEELRKKIYSLQEKLIAVLEQKDALAQKLYSLGYR